MAAVLNIDIHVNDDGSLAIRKVSEEARKAESSTKNLKNATDDLNSANNRASSSFTSLSNTMKGVGFAAAAYEVAKLGKYYVETADKMTTVESRLRLVTSSIEEQTKAHKELFNISQQTRLGFKETADLYSRIAIATKDYNISQDKLLSITGTINKAMIVSGGTAESMNSAIVQLGQAFSSNFQSVGQELASIREQTPALYQAIVAGSGMTSQAFKKAAEDGELSTEIIIKALEKQASAVDKDFDKMLKTVGQSMTTMSNSLMELIGFIDKSTGASSSLSEFITSISSSIDNFTKTLKNSNTELDSLAKKGNIKLEDNGILASILKANQGAGDALYKVLSETLGIVDKTAGEWSKIIDSSYSGMSKWVESVAGSLGIVEEKAKSTKKSIDSIVPSRPTVDNYTLVEDLPDRFTNRLSKKQEETSWSELFGVYKKEQDDKLKLQKKGQEDSDKLYEEWGKRKLDIGYSIAESEQDAFSKPYIELEKKYNEDLEKYGKLQGAKELITKEYQAKTQALNKETVEKFTKQEEEKYKKSNEWQVKLFDANEKINDQFITQREKMYGATSDVQIEAWYQNQLEWLGKLSLEGKATSEELQALLDKINGLKELKLKEQTISFKLEKSFYDSFENGLTDSIEDSFNGTLNLKKFFKTIQNSLTSTIASSMSGSIVNNLRGGTSLLGGLSSLAVGSSVSASEISTIMNSGGTFDSSSNTITTSGGSKINVGESGSGTVKSAGSDVMSLANTVSSLKTAYGLLSNGLSSSVLGMFQSGAGGLSSIGFTGAGSALGEFGVGFASPWATQAASAAASQAGATAGLYGSGVGQVGSAQMAGGYASGALMGAGVGYGVGTLGDKLFGAQTKAGSLGAVGGAIGSVFGPIGMISGSAIGSLIGGMFGTKKTKDTGIKFFENMDSLDTLSSDTVKAYADWEKKSWFSKKKGTNYSELSTTQMRQIEGVFDTYDYLLTQLGDNDKIWLDAGKYTGQTFQDAIAKNFIKAFTDVDQNVDGTIYSMWKEYADSASKSVLEAMSDSINSYISATRDFEKWSLERDGKTLESLQKQSQWANADLENLANMIGATGVTVENYTQMYASAIKSSFDADTITKWQQLGTALRSATDAGDAYKEALANQETALKQANEAIRQSTLNALAQQVSAWVGALDGIQWAINNLNPTFKTFSDLAKESLNLSNYSDLLSSLEDARQNEISAITEASNARIEQLNSEKSLFQDLSSFIDDLNLKLLGSNVTSDYFFSELDKAKETFASGGIVDTSKLTSSANSYLDSALKKSTSQLEYFRELAKVREGINSLGGMVTGGTLESVEAAIVSEKATLAFKLDQINNTALAILGAWKDTATTSLNTASNNYNAVNNDVVQKSYTDILGRTADTAGYQYWTNELTTGALNSGNITQAIASASIDEIYKNVLGREADVAGKNYWLSEIANGNIKPTDIDEAIKNAAKINGSHATGLDYVPFDGYIAELHKGERVQTASEVQKDSIITELKNEIKNLREITLKNAAETTRMSKIIDRVCPDGDALQVRITA